MENRRQNPLKAGIKITHNIIETPLLWSKIKGTKGLENLKVGNQGTNFTATKTEFKTILSLINNTTASNNKADMQAKTLSFMDLQEQERHTIALIRLLR